jgi:hypothetical protein
MRMHGQRNLVILIGIIAGAGIIAGLIAQGTKHTVTQSPLPTPPQGTASRTTSSPPTPSPWPTGTESQAFSGKVPPVPELTSIAASANAGMAASDRISFVFKQAAAPGYRAEFTSKVARAGSGAAVALPGSSFLQLTFNPAQAHDETGKSTLKTAPSDPVQTNLPELKSYVMNGDFEGQVLVALGLTAKAGYKISETHAAAAGTWTISVDIQHP